jgi:ubiquinone/menaquinone biosynthesis C-methylase UbiE
MSEADRIAALYERHAAVWDRTRGRGLMEREWLDRFVARLHPGAGILDIGCGSGEPIAQYFVANGCRVTGIDSAPSMLELCRKRFPDHEWILADMRDMALDRRFDGLIAWHSFFHLMPDDQHAMFAVFARHAAPGALLMFTSGTAHGEHIGEWQGEPLYHASLDSAEYERLLDAYGFDVIAHTVEDPVCGGATIWLSRMRT